MTNSRKMFKFAVEEMNFTKAARRAHVTQQCLSLHIKKLEEEYGTPLFERRPKLKLTGAGESLYQALCRLEIIEHSITEQMQDIKDERKGSISFGINASRARVLLPKIMEAYHARFPQVRVALVLEDMHRLVPRVLNGELDMFLGIDCIGNRNFRMIPLVKEEVFFIAKKSVLKQYAHTEAIYEKTIETGCIDLKEFLPIPMTGNNFGSSFTTLINRYFSAHNLNRDIVFSVSDYDLQIKICRKNNVAACCPKSVLPVVLQENEFGEEEKLHIFRLHDMEDRLRLDLILHKELYVSQYKQVFMDLVQKTIQEHLNEIDAKLM